MLCRGKIESTACQSGIGCASKFQQEYLHCDADWLQPETTGISVRDPRRWHNSTSSGYSSHSPPLSASASASAGFYSTCYTSASAASKLTDAGLAVIHETEIPRPIWPCTNFESCTGNWKSHREHSYSRYTKIYSYCRSNVSMCRDCLATQSTDDSARNVLIELSKTLNSGIDGGRSMTAEEMLENISKIVAKGIQAKFNGTYEIYEDRLYRNSYATNKTTTMCTSIGNDAVNPVNLRLYNKSSQVDRLSSKLSPKCSVPTIVLIPRCNGICSQAFVTETSQTQDKLIGESEKDRVGSKLETTPNELCYANDEPVYTTLDASDESSSYGIIGLPDKSMKRDWNKGITAFDKNMDFTLDGARAERLECAIARAKNRRQWCRALIMIFGLVFFVLSVIVVSMSVTRGRKMFGSM